MTSKICFKCGIKKDLNDFYKHSGMTNGHLNKCKDCSKNDSFKRLELVTSTPEGLEKERLRHREKYVRLGYKDKQKIWNEKRPYTENSKYKNLKRKLKTDKGIELHHWNYSNDFIEDVFFLKITEHRKAHKFLIKSIDNIFSDLEGNSLNTKEKHFNYLLSKNIIF